MNKQYILTFIKKKYIYPKPLIYVCMNHSLLTVTATKTHVEIM